MLIFPEMEAFSPKSWMPYFPEYGGLFPQRDECFYILIMVALSPWRQSWFPWRWKFFPQEMDAYFSENGGIFPLKMELVFPRDGGFLPQEIAAYFPWNGGLFPQELDALFSWSWGLFPREMNAFIILIALSPWKKAVFPEDGGIFPKRWMLIFRKWRHFPPEDGAGFPWRWRLFTAKDGCLFSRKRSPFAQSVQCIYFPEYGGPLFP